MSTTTSDTPRTDEQAWTPRWDGMGLEPQPVVDANFARQLERELNSALIRLKMRETAGGTITVTPKMRAHLESLFTHGAVPYTPGQPTSVRVKIDPNQTNA